MPGIKHDGSKVPLDLIDTKFLLALGQVLAFGANKYGRHNWRGGIVESRLIAAALRHLLAYNGGEDLDPESGLPHLAHASACLMMLVAQHEVNPELDDRYTRSDNASDG
jgi:hypothetical protein